MIAFLFFCEISHFSFTIHKIIIIMFLSPSYTPEVIDHFSQLCNKAADVLDDPNKCLVYSRTFKKWIVEEFKPEHISSTISLRRADNTNYHSLVTDYITKLMELAKTDKEAYAMILAIAQKRKIITDNFISDLSKLNDTKVVSPMETKLREKFIPMLKRTKTNTSDLFEMYLSVVHDIHINNDDIASIMKENVCLISDNHSSIFYMGAPICFTSRSQLYARTMPIDSFFSSHSMTYPLTTKNAFPADFNEIAAITMYQYTHKCLSII